ncbi:cell wall-active antibiotics response protein LiaF [Brevibacillus ruminantium]|uniref:Cell wall-active antibiotics response protein LiaF n=1 Tax=Brevibacillus ruminantium TaxID=2950604 RepID=A0ABY4WC44_9BACL|nr:cell wall-active antibiotics response protein LiaF [Brevibacillus ruminantium]USG64760.1 cell wall-active antibiotics response protein LiaF [Brevibacillus ruminantium]
MKLSRLHKMTAGVLIILTGVGLFLDSLHIISFGLFDLWPMALVYFGVRMWGNQKKLRGGILAALGIIIALDMWLGIGPDDLFNIIIPLLFIYFGFRLIRGRSGKGERPGLEEEPPEWKGDPPASDFGMRYEEPDRLEQRDAEPEPEPEPEHRPYGDNRNRHWRKKNGYRPSFGSFRSKDRASSYGGGSILSPKESKSSLIGDFHLTSGRFELSQMHIWHGIGGVVIDLSRAMLMVDEAFLVVDGWVGDVTIYVPVDMPVAVTAEVSVGDLEVFGHRQGGITRSVMIRSEQYEQETPKINVQISLLVGDIKVKYI